jgi:putative chitinase
VSITPELIARVMPAASAEDVIRYAPHLAAAALEFEINTSARVAAFLATLAEETEELERMEENLNYSAQGLANTWPGRYACIDAAGALARPLKPNGLAESLHRHPQAIANNVYADRLGNGDEASGDGWRYRGSGGIQETGKDNHYAAAMRFDVELERIGDWLRSPEGAMRSAAWGFARRGCNQLADAGRFDNVSDVINIGRPTAKVGDSIGWPARLAFFNAAKEALA